MVPATDERRPQGLARLIPALEWMPRYDRRWLRGDLAAGIAVTALVVPKNLGYADIAGVPLQNGLYAAAVGGIIYALFCTSRHISTGPSSSLAAVAGRRRPRDRASAATQAAELVARSRLSTGLLFILFAVFRLGWIAQFLSKAVITGFLAGAAVDVVIGELPKLTGTSSEGDNAWRELSRGSDRSATCTRRRWSSALGALALILALRFWAPRCPARWCWSSPGCSRSSLLDLGAHGVALVGDVPQRAADARAPGPRARLGPLRDDRHRGGRAALDRLLADRRRRAGLRGAAPLPDRRQPGVHGAGDGERRRRRASRGCRSRPASPPAR